MSSKCLAILLSSIISVTVHSQYYKRSQLDSLTQSYQQYEGKESVNAILHIAETYIAFHLDSALFYSQLAKEKSKSIAYDWGVYKSIYCNAKVLTETGSLIEAKNMLKPIGIWFKAHGFEEDYIKTGLLYNTCLIRIEGKYKGKDLANQLLKDAQALNNPHLISHAWYNSHNTEESWRNDLNFATCLDSAKFYAEIAKDSLMLNRIKYMQLGDIFQSRDKTEQIRGLYKEAKRWENKYLIHSCLLNISKNFAVQGQLDSCTVIFNQSVQILEEFNSKNSLRRSLNAMAHTHRFMGNYQIALKYFIQALELSEQQNNQIAASDLHYQIAITYGNIEKHESSILHVLKTLEISESINDMRMMINANQMLGNLYYLTGKYEKAETEYLKTIDWIEENLIENVKSYSLVGIYSQLGEIARKRKEYDKARAFYNLSIENNQDRNLRQKAIIHNMILSSYIDEGNLKKGKEEYQKMLDNFDRQLLKTLPEFDYSSGQLYLEDKNYIAAKQAFQVFIEKSDVIKISEPYKTAYFNLAECNEQLGDYKQAFINFKKYKEIEDSIELINSVENIEKIQVEHEISLKESEIERMHQKQKISDLTLAQQGNKIALRNLSIILLIFALIGLAGGGYIIFKRLRSKKEKENREVKKQLEIEQIKSEQKILLAEIKNNLYANISHEFKTPLTLIRVPLQHYSEQALQSDKPVFDSILKNTDYLLEMLDELIDVSRMDLDKPNLQITTFNLSTFLSQIKLNFSPLFSDKNLRFDWNTRLMNDLFVGDEGRLKIVINNLLKNAFENSINHGWISCNIELSDVLKIEVANAGKNIDANKLPYIFDRFYRAEENNYSGAGIGLAWSKQIVEMHNGTISVNNKISDQVSFCVQLPIKNIPSNSLVASSLSRIKPTNKDALPLTADSPRLLIVEDNLEIQELLNKVLKNEFQLEFAKNGVIGEEMAVQLQPDLVLSDIMMPLKDGFELLKSLKENFNTSHIPVILLTARDDTDSRIIGLNQNADDYIGKPFDVAELKARINNLLRQRLHLHKLFSENPLLFSKEINCTALDADFIDKARNVLEKHYSNGDFTVNLFCMELGLNRTSVNNKLKALTNHSTASYIRNFRLEKALKMLIENKLTIKEISIDTGFNSIQVFNKAFKNKFETTPTVYRASLNG